MFRVYRISRASGLPRLGVALRYPPLDFELVGLRFPETRSGLIEQEKLGDIIRSSSMSKEYLRLPFSPVIQLLPA